MSRHDPRKQPVATALRAVIEDLIRTEQLSGIVAVADMLADSLADRPPNNRQAYLALLDAVTTGSAQVRADSS